MKRTVKKVLALTLSFTMAFSPVTYIQAEATEQTAENTQNETEKKAEAKQAEAERQTEKAAGKTDAAEAEKAARAETKAEETEKAAPAETKAEETEKAAPAETKQAETENPSEVETKAEAASRPETKAEAEAVSQPETKTEAEAASQPETKTEQETSVRASEAAEAENTVRAAEGTEPPKQLEKGKETEKNTEKADVADFKPVKVDVKEDGEKLEVAVVLDNNKFSKIYVGNRADGSKQPEVKGIPNEFGGCTFTFELPAEKLGRKITVVPYHEASESWLTDEDVFVQIPDAVETEALSDSALPEETAVIPEAEESEAAVQTEYAAEITADGQYNVPTVETDSAMFKVVKCVLNLQGGAMTAVVTLSGTGYDYLYVGSAADAKEAGESAWIPFAADADGKYTYSVPVSALDTAIAIAAHSIKSDRWIDRTLTFRSEGMEQAGGGSGETAGPNDGTETEAPIVPEIPQGDAGVQVQKPDGSGYKMFAVDKSSAKINGDKIEIVFHTPNVSYNKIYLGNQGDDPKEPVIMGTGLQDGSFIFCFEVPLESKGQKLPIVAGLKKDGSWSKTELYLAVPEDPETESEPESETERETESEPETEVPPVPEIPQGDAGVQVQKPDGSGYKMFAVDKSSAKINGDKIEIVFHTPNVSYNKIYIGNQGDDPKEPVIMGTELQDGSYIFRFEVPLESKGQRLSIVVGLKKDGSWSKTELYLAVPENPETESETETETETPTTPAPAPDPVPTPEPTPEPTPSPAPGQLTDGQYRVPTVESSASMFRVVDCVLNVNAGSMTAVITLSGTGYDYLYMGTAAEAGKAAPEAWIKFAPDTSGKYTYTIPVESLDRGIAVAAHSIKNNQWYDRTLTFKSAGMEKISADDPGTVNPPSDNNGKDDNNKNDSKDDGKDDKDKDKDKDKVSKHEKDLSGSTSRVDNSTVLADGVYTPDSFSWSGGSGRASISCNKVTVTNGQAYATIVFGSDAYAYVKASGNKYYPTHSGNTSIFVIPIELNKNNRIIGMTTKMSASHEIAYTVYVALEAAKKDGKDSEDGSGTNNQKLDEEAPDITGLEYVDDAALEYAKYFKIYHYAQDITLLEIDMMADTARKTDAKDEAETVAKPESEEEAASTEEDSSLYQGNVVKYLIVPEGVELPVGLDKEMVVIQSPVENAYVGSGEGLSMMDQLGLADRIALTGIAQDECEAESIAAAMADGRIVYAGGYEDLEYRTLLKEKCGLSILPGEVLPKEDAAEEQEARLKEIAGNYEMLGIPMIVDRSADEEDEKAQKEWIKVYGALFGCEKEAEELFGNMAK